MDVRRFIDLHVHIGPEIIPRRFTAGSLAREESGKLRGVALKNHFVPTTPFIREIQEENDILLIGSVTLNNYVGGLNPDAVYSAAKLSDKPIIVWFPTINATNFLKTSRYELPPEWVGNGFTSRLSGKIIGITITGKDGELTQQACRVLESIKENDCILATGHLSWQESDILVKKAISLGIDRIVITHPIYQKIDMPIEVQQELVKSKGVYIEQTYAMCLIDKIPIDVIAEQIRQLGPENCIISSDVGQISSPGPSVALERFTELLIEQGLTEDQLRIMGERNPRRLLGI